MLQIVKDVKFTVNQTVEPMEKGFTKFNEKLHKISENIKKRDKDKRSKDDSSIGTSSPPRKVIRGIDDPLLNGSVSDSGFLKSRGRKHRKKSGYSSGSGGESSSDHTYGGYMIHGRRWVVKD